MLLPAPDSTGLLWRVLRPYKVSIGDLLKGAGIYMNTRNIPKNGPSNGPWMVTIPIRVQPVSELTQGPNASEGWVTGIYDFRPVRRLLHGKLLMILKVSTTHVTMI